MLSLLRTLSLGYLGKHPTRTALVILSIALGVATLLATQSLNRGLGKAAQTGFNPFAEFADLLVTNGQSGVPLSLADEIENGQLQGIAEIQPVILARVGVADLKRRSVMLLGLDWERMARKEKEASSIFAKNSTATAFGIEVEPTFQARSWKDALTLVFLANAAVTEQLSLDLEATPDKGRTFSLRLAGHQPKLLQVARIKVNREVLAIEGDIVLLNIHAASQLAYPLKPGTVGQIGIKWNKEIPLEDLQKALTQLVGKRAQVVRVAAEREMVADVTGGIELGFAILGACALVIGLFLVYNALSVSVAERRHDIGILRAVGATRWQIAGLFVSEAIGLGFVGSVLGLPLGYFLAWLAIKPLAHVLRELFVSVPNVALDASPRLLLVAVLSGIGTAVLAALVPAWRAAQEEPAHAVRRVPQQLGWASSVFQLGGVALLFFVGLVFVFLRGALPPRIGTFAAVICFLLAALVGAPLLAAQVGRLFQPLFRYFLGLEGRLAADNLVRAPGRTGLVIAALAATSGLMVQTAGVLRSTEQAVYDWIDDKIDADLFISAGAAATSAGQALSIRNQIGLDIRAMPEVEAVMPVRFHQQTYNDRLLLLVAVDMDAFDQGGKHRPIAQTIQRYPAIRQPGKVLVSENFAALHNVAVGQRITIQGPDRWIDLDVVGTMVDYTSNRGTILVSRDWYRQEYKDDVVDVFDVFLKPGIDPLDIKARLEERWGLSDSLFVITRQELRKEVSEQLQKVYALAYAQQTVIGMVALLGVASALFISVLQRRRELGLLRAVGATRSQILGSVLTEAILMGIIGAIVGFGTGLALEWYVLDILLLDEAGFQFPLRVPWYEAGVVIFASVLSATLAGLWPAYLATRLRIPEAIAYE